MTSPSPNPENPQQPQPFKKKTSRLAIASLLVNVLIIFSTERLAGIIIASAAIILAILAIFDTTNNPRLRGKTVAITGLTAETTYTYRVQARDGASTPNTNTWSTTVSETTPSCTDPNLIAHWKLDESSRTIANDATNNGNDGTLTNMAGTEWTSGAINGGLAFDGNNLYIYVDGSLDSSDTYTGSLTANSTNLTLSNAGDLDGRLDDVRIYNEALSSTEVDDLYDLGS